MIAKFYDILLDNRKIGSTELEYADPPMGVVHGKVIFTDITSGYEFFKSYCVNNGIEVLTDYPDKRLIATGHIYNLRVVTPNGIEIQGQGNNIEGMDSDTFQVTILGVESPLFQEEFAHHIKAYYDRF